MSLRPSAVPKKILIVAYYWPPAGGPGVQRWLKFVKYLPDFEVIPTIVVPERPNYPILDPSLEAEVSDKLNIIRIPIKEPYKLAQFISRKKTATISKGLIGDAKTQSFLERFLLFVRGNFFIPDARVAWVNPVTQFLLDYIPKHSIDTIVTTGPPHSMHLIGLNLKKHFNVKWLADFRDPWTSIGYHKQLKLLPFAQKKHKTYESDVLRAANSIIVTSQVTKLEFETITSTPIHVITNGYDEKEESQQVVLDDKFTIAHIGSLLSGRNPKILWEALSDLVAENLEFRANFQLNFVGYVSDVVLQTLESYDLIKYSSNIGYVSHSEAVSFQKKSQILLLIEIDSEATRCIIPGKLFEYMVSQRPIIALGPKGSDVAQILETTNTGNYFSYEEKDALKKLILEHYKAFTRGDLKTQPVGLQNYHRRELTKALAQLV